MGGIRIISDKNGTYGVEISSFYSGKKIYVSNKNEDISIIFLSQAFSVYIYINCTVYNGKNSSKNDITIPN